MTTETLPVIAAFVGASAIGGGLLSLLVILTVAFPRIAMIEEKVAGLGASVRFHKRIWGNDPFGRLMRSSYVFTFLVFRYAPSNRLNRTAAQIGDVSVSLPVRLRLWGLVPPMALLGCFLVLLVTGLFL